MLRWDGNYKVIEANPAASSYKLALPDSSGRHVAFHSFRLNRFVPNDKKSPNCEREFPGAIVTEDGVEEWFIDRIIDQRRRGRGLQYLVCWRGEGPEGDLWLPRRKLED